MTTGTASNVNLRPDTVLVGGGVGVGHTRSSVLAEYFCYEFASVAVA